MARVGTAALNLGMWLDGENPGAGSQSVDNTGLNGNWQKLETAIATEHNANGTHKAASILKGYLHSAVADGATLELDATAGLRIKDLGVSSGKIAANAVIAGKLADGAVDTAGRLAANVVTTAKILDANVTTAKIADGNVTAAKLAHDNNARKLYLHGIIKSTTTYLRLSDVADTHNFRMLRAGAITGISAVDLTDDSSDQQTQTYATAVSEATGKFSVGGRIGCYRNTSTGVIHPTINGTQVSGLDPNGGGLSNPTTGDLAITIEYELDD